MNETTAILWLAIALIFALLGIFYLTRSLAATNGKILGFAERCLGQALAESENQREFARIRFAGDHRREPSAPVGTRTERPRSPIDPIAAAMAAMESGNDPGSYTG